MIHATTHIQLTIYMNEAINIYRLGFIDVEIILELKLFNDNEVFQIL